MNDKHQMPELVWTPAGYVPKWLYDWTGENAECSGCGGITVRADEDGASTCCGTPTMLPIDRVWKMAIDRTSPLDVEALRVELLDWANSMPRPYDAYDETEAWRDRLRSILTEAQAGAATPEGEVGRSHVAPPSPPAAPVYVEPGDEVKVVYDTTSVGTVVAEFEGLIVALWDDGEFHGDSPSELITPDGRPVAGFREREPLSVVMGDGRSFVPNSELVQQWYDNVRMTADEVECQQLAEATQRIAELEREVADLRDGKLRGDSDG